MAVVYYPYSASIYSREVVGSSLIQTIINTTPDIIIVFSGSTAFTSSIATGGRSMVLCSAYTPTETGADTAEVSVPYSNGDGITPISWSVRRLSLRTVTAESSTSSIDIEKSIGTGPFSAVAVGSLTLSSGSYEIYTGSVAQVNSGDKLRFNVTNLGTATAWTVITELSST